MTTARALSLLCLCLIGCGGLSSRFDSDAGNPPGIEHVGPPSDGGDDGGTADRDAGGKPDKVDAGGSTGDAGSSVDTGGNTPDVFTGDGGVLRWTARGVPVEARYVVAVSARGPDDIWAVATGGQGNVLLRYQNAAAGFVKVRLMPELVSPSALYAGPGGRVAIAGSNALVWCDSNCSAPNDIHSQSLTGVSFTGLCGRGNTLYAVGVDGQNQEGAILEWSPSGWAPRLTRGPVTHLKSCVVTRSGRLFAAGFQAVLRRDPDGTVAREAIDLPGKLGADIQQWLAIDGTDELLHAAGDARRIAARGPDGKWKLVFESNDDLTSFYALAGHAPHELYAAGRSFEMADTAFARFAADEWMFISPINPRGEISSLTRVTDNWYVAGGQLLNAIGGVEGGFIAFGQR